MTRPLAEPSWIERTIKLCDHVLIRAANADPANLLLRDAAPGKKAARAAEQNPDSTSTRLASQA